MVRPADLGTFATENVILTDPHGGGGGTHGRSIRAGQEAAGGGNADKGLSLWFLQKEQTTPSKSS